MKLKGKAPRAVVGADNTEGHVLVTATPELSWSVYDGHGDMQEWKSARNVPVRDIPEIDPPS
jgi:hypothetical protein